jgi:hypothetical protein
MCKMTNARSNGPCTGKQYGYIAGVIDAIIDPRGPSIHGPVLSAILDREVSKENVIGEDLARVLFDILLEMKTEKGADGKKVKSPNPLFDEQAVLAIQEIFTYLPVGATI